MNPEDTRHEPPGAATLIKASISAGLLAALALAVVVLPAEYGIDPTGVGGKLGLTALAESSARGTPTDATSGSSADALDVAPAAATDAVTEATLGVATDGATGQRSTDTDTDPRSRTIEVLVLSGEGIEQKFLMDEGAKLTYEWSTGGQPLYLDLHGEPEGDTTGYFESYVVATSNAMSGSFTAPFDGTHGWYWRNDTEDDVAVLLQVKGWFEEIDPQ